MLAASLKPGMTTETAGCGRASARSGCAPARSSCMTPQDLLQRTGRVLHILARHAGKQREGQDALGGARRMRQGIGPQRELLAVEAVEMEGLEVQADPDVRGEEVVITWSRPTPRPSSWGRDTSRVQAWCGGWGT